VTKAERTPGAKFEIARSADGAGWRIALRQGFGRMQYIGIFETELEARGWIEKDASHWLTALQAKL
jgi:hypothetical protein